MRRMAAWALALAIATTLPPAARGAAIWIVNKDDAGRGLNDPTPVEPVGGNPGRTLGEQRLFVLQTAAATWASRLYDRIPVSVEVRFEPLSCSEAGAVLGMGGAIEFDRDFRNAPYRSTWYSAALANRLATADLNREESDVALTFNSALGSATCDRHWYLGVDGRAGGDCDLLRVALHELAHGLGFQTSTDETSGEELDGSPSIYDRRLLDRATGRHWNDESAAERAASAVGCDRLVWDGPAVRAHAAEVLLPVALVRVVAPAPVDYEAGVAAFGPPVSTTPVTGTVAMVDDGVGHPADACEPIPGDLTGQIAFVDRGSCTFVTKVLHAQQAGAIGVIVADSVADCLPREMAGDDPGITIPAVRITLEDGLALRAAIAGGVTASIVADPARLAGTDDAGRPRMYTPVGGSGSSVSHWDTTPRPQLLMEPFIYPGEPGNLDLTPWVLHDIGWYIGTGIPPDPGMNVLEPCTPNPTRGPAEITFIIAREMPVRLGVFDLAGRRVASLADGTWPAGRHVLGWAGVDAGGRQAPSGVYQVHLWTPDFSESRSIVLAR